MKNTGNTVQLPVKLSMKEQWHGIWGSSQRTQINPKAASL